MHVSPFIVQPVVLIVLVMAGIAGTKFRRRFPNAVADDHATQFIALQASILALLGLLLGFSFSMAVGRFDERRRAEIEEANSIGTSYMRTSTLEDGTAKPEEELMRQYVAARIEFYAAGNDGARIEEARKRTQDLQGKMWARAMQVGSAERANPRDAMVSAYLASLTELFDASERRQAAYENRIPLSAWALLLIVAATASFLVGLGVWRWNALLLIILPVVVSSTLTLVYDLDSPRNGLIRVKQQSMERVRQQVEGGR